MTPKQALVQIGQTRAGVSLSAARCSRVGSLEMPLSECTLAQCRTFMSAERTVPMRLPGYSLVQLQLHSTRRARRANQKPRQLLQFEHRSS
jgi:hypothetical protein